MIVARAGSGWQTALADLSLILFMVAASALAHAPGNSPRASPRAEPLAVWRAGPGMPPLAEWIASQADPRQSLTIVAPYAPGRQAQALADAEALLHAAGAAGLNARLVIEPGSGAPRAALAYDDPQRVARGLQ